MAEGARDRARRYRNLEKRLLNEPLSDAAYDAVAVSAAFDAFVALGGDVDAPEAFDWAGQHDALVRQAKLAIRREVTGSKSVFGDTSNRLRARREGLGVDGLSWGAWADVSYQLAPDDRARGRRIAAQAGPSVVPAPERAAHEAQLAPLLGALEAVLTAREYRWMYEREILGLSLQQQAAALVAADPKYQDASGPARAENVIEVTLHRARKKAAAKLAGSWRALAEDVVA